VAKATGPDGWFVRPIGPAEPGSTLDEAATVAGRLTAPSRTATRAGLPLREPRAHLVPGAFSGAEPPATGAGDAPRRSAEEIRDRLGGYQRGLRRARQADPE